MSDKKVFAVLDLLIDGEHVDAGDEVHTDKETREQLLRSGRLTEDAKLAKSIRDAGAVVKAARESSAQDAKLAAFLKLADDLGIQLPPPAAEGAPNA